MERKDPHISRGYTVPIRIALFLLSAATLLFEINLTRLFSVAQFYHFAFVVVSLALLGFGASGTCLAVFPELLTRNPSKTFPILGVASSASMLAAYLLMNWLPFDSFSLAWDRRQIFYLILNYLALVTPFFFSGLSTSLLLSGYAQKAGNVYAINLMGSAAGCLAALVMPSVLGGEGLVSLSSAIAGLAALIAWMPLLTSAFAISPNKKTRHWIAMRGSLLALLALVVCFVSISDIGLRMTGRSGLPWMALHLSPYKSLSYALQYPGAQLRSQEWNAVSRIDVVRSGGIRSMPGLSYRYLKPPPAQDGLLVDGDDLSPIPIEIPDLEPYYFLPAQLAFILRPDAKTLVLEPRGGLDVLAALAGGSQEIFLTEPNPLIVEAAAEIYSLSGVHPILRSSRGYLNYTDDRFDVIILPLTSSYHPVRSGAYSLAEDYRYTIEAFEALLDHLNPGGVLVVTRWMQNPPSESLRTFALAVTALRQRQSHADDLLAVLRGYNTATLFVKESKFTSEELANIRRFASERAFDLDYLPGLQPGEANRFNVLPDANSYQVYAQFLEAESPEQFYETYPFDVRPPTDNRPFFSHFFKWEQAGQVIAEAGRTWQPFGGAGYFLMIALLLLASISAALLILVPLWASHRRAHLTEMTWVPAKNKWAVLLYFGSIGIAYLFVEIPLIQKFILFTDNPAYAITLVLFSLLLFSGLGSQMSGYIRTQHAILLLAVMVSTYPALLGILFERSLGYPTPIKLVTSVFVLAPLGFLMGLPFPAGIRTLSAWNSHRVLIPWAWGINGAASVISSILAALLALSRGFPLVLILGGACYASAWIMGMVMASLNPVQPPPR